MKAILKFPKEEKGGPGSGHFGHAGRPGKRGGSLPGGGSGFASFDNVSEAREFVLANDFDAAIKALQVDIGLEAERINYAWEPSSIEASALWNYTGEGYYDVNNILRKGYDPSRLESGTMAGLEILFNRPEAIVPENITVKRGFSTNFFNDKPVGTIFKDLGYVSTSIDPNLSKRFGPERASVRVPAGTRGIYLSQFTFKPHETELLLNRGTEFQVVQNNSQGVIVEVLQ